MAVEFSTVLDAFESQRVDVLDDSIIEMGLGDREWEGGQIEMPTSLFRAIAQSVRVLRLDPDARLISKRFDINRTDLPPDDVALETFLSMVDASVFPVNPGIPRSPYVIKRHFVSRGVGEIATCFYAEQDFLGTLVNIDAWSHDPTDTLSITRGCQVFTEEGEPVLLRKSKSAGGLTSALSLVALAINGIPYPAGSLMRVDWAHDGKSANVPWDDMQTVEAREITGIAQMRPSLFALPPGQRAEYFGASLRDEVRSRIERLLLPNITMDTVRDIVKDTLAWKADRQQS